ncbi:MAG: Hydrogenase maturation protein HypF [Rhodocyclaceae bacterium]|nr:Hydrogenase maturation protein HypF [Rhodocyclaceae bacterium]
MTACRIRVRGLVQGVGFRPYVWRLARELGVDGWVRNDAEGVEIEARAGAEPLKAFLERLPREAPRLARIDAVETEAVAAGVAGAGFAILESGAGAGAVATAIGPDAALCPDCMADLFDPAGRRWRYAFTTCTHCGPRYTVSRGVPYDRARTSLAAFPLCPPCAREYADPADRRFHAETTACPDCGPRLSLLDAAGRTLSGEPIAETLKLLQAGRIVALKGLGGFHLACDARNGAAVAELRRRKQREEKPFAVMALNPASLVRFARVGEAEAALLESREAPIVLCPKADSELPGVAPGLAWLGAMVPATPLHLLLWHEAAGRPAGTAWLAAPHEFLLVMTSANPHGEPLVTGNDEALERLSGIADAFLAHDREIVVRCDDSVVRATETGPALIRRARGYTPVPVPLAEDGPAVLAFGAYLKNTACVLKGRQAFLSQHIGGLDNAAAIGFLEETVAHLLDILDVEPAAVAHDLHPDFPSTRLAAAFAAERGIPALAVGHHHAHIAAVCAEHGVDGPVLGLALDGVGLGTDGGLWGGELLRVEGARSERLGHLAPLLLPGGDRAAREPWRMAASALFACGRQGDIANFTARRYPGRDGGRLALMLERGFNCPTTSSLGRLFDAAAGLLGLRAEARYEGQAAMELEGLAAGHGSAAPLPDGVGRTGSIPDFARLLSFLADCDDAAFGAAVFHATVAAGLAEWAIGMAEETGIGTVACAGGCAMNAVLIADLQGRLAKRGLTLLEARRAPPNDGGLALGQGWVARRMFEETN